MVREGNRFIGGLNTTEEEFWGSRYLRESRVKINVKIKLTTIDVVKGK
jgi:hypothetical protein